MAAELRPGLSPKPCLPTILAAVTEAVYVVDCVHGNTSWHHHGELAYKFHTIDRN
jgi:hypothetical protein